MAKAKKKKPVANPFKYIVACRKKGVKSPKAEMFGFPTRRKAEAFITDANDLGFDCLLGTPSKKAGRK